MLQAVHQSMVEIIVIINGAHWHLRQHTVILSYVAWLHNQYNFIPKSLRILLLAVSHTLSPYIRE